MTHDQKNFLLGLIPLTILFLLALYFWTSFILMDWIIFHWPPIIKMVNRFLILVWGAFMVYGIIHNWNSMEKIKKG